MPVVHDSHNFVLSTLVTKTNGHERYMEINQRINRVYCFVDMGFVPVCHNRVGLILNQLLLCT
jgi:hypothetical protein